MSESHSRPPPAKRGKPISMHEDVPLWYDCCSCEAEPYWQELAEEECSEHQGPKETGRQRTTK